MKIAGQEDTRDGFGSRDVPCRECGEPTTIPGSVVDMAISFSKYCRERGWAPLKANEITACESCRAEVEAVREKRTSEAHWILVDLAKAAFATGSLSSALMATPHWFRDEYRDQVADIQRAADARRASSASKPETRRGIR